MIRISIIVSLIAFAVSCIQQENEEFLVEKEIEFEIPERYISANDPTITRERNGDIFLNNLPFSGYLIELHTNDTISLKIGYYNGKQNGTMIAYYDDGMIRFIRTYYEGEKHGTHVGFHRNGTKAFEFHFVNGFSEGNHKEWFENGGLAADMNYVNGKEFGRQQAWRPDGKIRSNYIVRENGRRYGLMGIKRCTKLDGVTKSVDPYKGERR